MFLKYILSFLCVIISLHAGEPLKKRGHALDPASVNYSWAIQYEAEGNYRESFNYFLKVIRNGKPLTLKKNDFEITRSKENLKIEFAVISLVRHFEHQLQQNNPNACGASIYHKDGIQRLLEVEEYYTAALAEHGCLLSAVNLGNIARAEGKKEMALEYYRCVVAHQSNLSPVEQFSLFAIGYPIITEYPIQTKPSSIQELLKILLVKNDYYVQEFKRSYPAVYDKALNEILNETNL